MLTAEFLELFTLRSVNKEVRMGLMDNMNDTMDGNMKDRFEELRSKAQAGQLDDKGMAEYERLREHFDKQ
jgi:hypothetical protein